MPMNAEQRKQIAKDTYEDLLRTHKPDVARAMMMENHGLTKEQMDDPEEGIAPRKPSLVKPVPTRATLEAELETVAGLLRSVAAALRSPKPQGDYRRLAKNADKRASTIEQLLSYKKEVK